MSNRNKRNKTKDNKKKKINTKKGNKYIEDDEDIISNEENEDKKNLYKIDIVSDKEDDNKLDNISDNEINEIIKSIDFNEYSFNSEDQNNKDDEISRKEEELTNVKFEPNKEIINKKFNPFSKNNNLNNENNPFINLLQKNKNSNSKENKDYFPDSPSKNSHETKNEKLETNKININENQKVELGKIKKDYLLCFNEIKTVNSKNLLYKNITYKGKNFYLMNKIKSITDKQILHYYCRNHDTCKSSFDGKRHSICEAKIDYNIEEDEYKIIENHSKMCLNFEEVYSVTQNITNREIKNYEEYKEILLDLLNNNPLLILSNFLKKAIELYRGNEYYFTLSKNTLRNIYYKWRNNNIIFTKFSIFSNNKTKDGELYMRDFVSTYIYKKNDSNQLIKHEHIIFISPFQIRKIISASHLYFDCTFIYPNEFSQLLIILYYDEEINMRSPGAYILLNNKTENGYYLALSNLKKILTLDNNVNLKLISYTTDYEKALYNALEKLFPDIRRIGCYFHYSYNLRKKLKEYNLYTEEYIKISEELLKELLKYFLKFRRIQI